MKGNIEICINIKYYFDDTFVNIVSSNKFLISRLIKNRATSCRKPTFDYRCSMQYQDRKFLIERSTRVFFPVKNFSLSRIEQI